MVPHIILVDLYDQLSDDGPKLTTIATKIFMPGEEAPDAIYWRNASEPRQWLLTDDNGVVECLRIFRISSTYGPFVKTAVGCLSKKSKSKMLVTNIKQDHNTKVLFAQITPTNSIPLKLKEWVDLSYDTSDPLLAWRLVSPWRKANIWKELKVAPGILKIREKSDRRSLLAAFRRKDVQWYMRHKLKGSLERSGLTRDYVLARLRDLLEDPKTSAEVVRKTCLNLLEAWESSESNGVTELGGQSEPPIGIAGDANKIKMIRARRSTLRERSRDILDAEYEVLGTEVSNDKTTKEAKHKEGNQEARCPDEEGEGGRNDSKGVCERSKISSRQVLKTHKGAGQLRQDSTFHKTQEEKAQQEVISYGQ